MVPNADPQIVMLRDGIAVRIRPVTPDDAVGLQEGVRAMSRTSRYLRFFAGVNELSPEQLRYFTQVDQVNHVAWCGVEPGESRGYGLARFLRTLENPVAAEFAVAVIDTMQGKGLGTILMAVLYLRARALGVDELVAEIVPDNPIMPHWMPRLGANLTWDRRESLYRLRWNLADPMPDNPTSRRFKEWTARMAGVTGRNPA